VAVQKYLAAKERKVRASSLRSYQQLFNHDVLPYCGERALADSGKGHILELLNRKATKITQC
jgi:hypothetical protein